MGIDYKAAIVVGLPYGDFLEGSIDEAIELGELEAFSPYFDAPYEHCIVGFAVEQTKDYSACELFFNTSKSLELCMKFNLITGLDAKLYLTTYGY